MKSKLRETVSRVLEDYDIEDNAVVEDLLDALSVELDEFYDDEEDDDPELEDG